MINFNGTLVTQDSNILTQNRGFLYGDAVFETVKIVNSKVLFVEDHYFRLMASMRVVRMEIPMNFTMEYFEEQILNGLDLHEGTTKSGNPIGIIPARQVLHVQWVVTIGVTTTRCAGKCDAIFLVYRNGRHLEHGERCC